MICARCKQEHDEKTKLCLACKEYRKQYQQNYRKQNVNSKQRKQVTINLTKKNNKIYARRINVPEKDATIRFLSFFAEYIKVPKYWSLTTKKQLKKAISIQILKI